MNDLVVITGQTATGKTKLALEYALRLNGELVSADSRQVYKHLDIVTGKDRVELEKTGIKVHLLDVVDPNQSFSSHDFITAALPIVKDIWSRNKTPIIVGGTYLYIKHLLYGQDVQISPDARLREALEKLTVQELQKELKSLDEVSYSKLNNSDLHNSRRLIRKIEILKNKNAVKTTQQTPALPVGRSSISTDGLGVEVNNLTMIGLKHKDRDALVNAIIERVEKRLTQGALAETQKLLASSYKKTDEGLQTIGYKQLIEHIEGKISLEQAKQEWINKEVQYAKRQLTFMKLDPNIKWQEV